MLTFQNFKLLQCSSKSDCIFSGEVVLLQELPHIVISLLYFWKTGGLTVLWGLQDPHPLRIFSELTWGEYGHFLEPHNSKDYSGVQLSALSQVQIV